MAESIKNSADLWNNNVNSKKQQQSMMESD